MKEIARLLRGIASPDSGITTVHTLRRENPKYTKVQTLDELAEVLQRMGCQNIRRVFYLKVATGVRWTVDKKGSFLGIIGSEESIIPRAVVFTNDKKNDMRYHLEVGGVALTTESDNQVTQDFLGATGERLNTTRATNSFLYPFATEPHTILAKTDLFDFQFYTGMNKKDKDVRVTIGGTKFTFKPTSRTNSAISGKVTVEVPSK